MSFIRSVRRSLAAKGLPLCASGGELLFPVIESHLLFQPNHRETMSRRKLFCLNIIDDCNMVDNHCQEYTCRRVCQGVAGTDIKFRRKTLIYLTIKYPEKENQLAPVRAYM